MFNFSDQPRRARAELGPLFTKPELYYSTTREWFYNPLPYHTQVPRMIAPDTSLGYKRLLERAKAQLVIQFPQPKLDLELRLGQPGQAPTYLRRTTRVTRTSQEHNIPKHLRLTLGHKTWAKDYVRRGRPPSLSYLLQRHPRVTPKTRDFYGPCERCNMFFETSQLYAAHMRAHYMKEETVEQKMARRAKKYNYPNY
ncbi:C2H2-like zinc finger protein [Tanacetum coccineum]